jgi:putative ABC transport system permease protein
VFSDQDDAVHAPVAIINETAARRLWGGDPMGARVRTGGPDEPWRTIIGIVGDVYQYGLDSQKTMQVYLPYAQNRVFDLTLLVRADVEPISLVSAVRSAVLVVDKDQPVSEIATMEEVLADSVAGKKFSTVLLFIFGAGALMLAAIGIYGVIAYSVSQRTSEFGIRLALGAQKSDVLGMVLRQGLGLVCGGIVLGLIGAVALTHLLASLLFGVSTTDLVTFSAVPIILGVVALLASYIPAWRATRVDPMNALRYE